MKKIFTDIIHHRDARTIGSVIKEKVVTTTITSPPYFDMKDYGSDNQIGYGQCYSDYLEDLKKVFSSIYDITKDNGTLWVIIDSYKENGRVIPLPFDLEREISSIGWMLQDIIIWKKDRTVPWGSKGRTQRKFEYILFFSKNSDYHYFSERVTTTDVDQLKKWWITYPERYSPSGKAIDGIWEFPIPTQGSWGKKFIRHFCPLPSALVERIIKLSTDEGDIVLDPFSGSGTVPAQAAYMNRRYIGFELNESYIKMFEEYLGASLEERRMKYMRAPRYNEKSFYEMIVRLRILKYIKSILKYLIKEGFSPKIAIAELEGESGVKNKLVKASYLICAPKDELEVILSMINEIIVKAPLSKFGVDPVFELVSGVGDKAGAYYGYTLNNTHKSAGRYEIDSAPKRVCIFSSMLMDVDMSEFE